MIAESTPGPNAFFPQTTRTGVNKGPAFSLQGGFKKGRSKKKSNVFRVLTLTHRFCVLKLLTLAPQVRNWI